MLTRLLLLSTLALGVRSDRTPDGCTIGETWTDKFIRFECFKGDGAVVQGVRPTGCVPSNTDDGDFIEAGETFDSELFTYQCSIHVQDDRSIATYTIINCIDAKGEALAVGESRVMDDGSAWRCFKDDAGAVKLARGKKGCVVDGIVKEAGTTWKMPTELKASVNGVEKLIGKAEVLKCIRGKNGKFEATSYGCITVTGASLRDKGFSTVGKDFVQCLIGEDGTISMKIVEANMVSCEWKGTELKSGETSTVEGDVIACKFGKALKTGCMVDGKFIKVGLAYMDGKAYQCLDGAGLHQFGDLTGCTDADGSIKPFNSVWQRGEEFYKCLYALKNGKVSTTIKVIGCAFKVGAKWIAVAPGKIGVNGNEKKMCALEGNIRKMRELTVQELAKIQQQRKKQKVITDIFGGEEGKGEGGVHETTDQCRDLLEVYKTIEPVCQRPLNETPISELIEIMAKLKVTVSNIKAILEKNLKSTTM